MSDLNYWYVSSILGLEHVPVLNGCITYFLAGTVNIILQDVLIFATALDCKPPLVFKQCPQLRFIHDNERILPTASTCSFVLSLPTAPCEYSLFKQRMEMSFGGDSSLVQCKVIIIIIIIYSPKLI